MSDYMNFIDKEDHGLEAKPLCEKATTITDKYPDQENAAD